MDDKTTTIETLKARISQFNKERDWEQFHTPKNVSMAIAAEAAELMEIFLWCESKESKKVVEERREEARQEVADILIMLLIFCSQSNIDLVQAVVDKMKINAKKYPVEKAKGKSDKYDKLL